MSQAKHKSTADAHFAHYRHPPEPAGTRAPLDEHLALIKPVVVALLRSSGTGSASGQRRSAEKNVSAIAGRAVQSGRAPSWRIIRRSVRDEICLCDETSSESVYRDDGVSDAFAGRLDEE